MLLAGIAMLGLNSCGIEPDNRFVEMEEVKPERAVLLMDFTGQNCVNCPQAHEVMEELVNQYGDKSLITVSIHAGALSISTDRTNFERERIGLMIQEGNEMNDAFGINSWPMGVVDRINANGAAINTGQWATAVRNALQKPTDIKIEAEASLNGDNIEVSARAICTSNRNAALQVWVVEDGIIAQQVTPEGRKTDYVHNNVLRFVQYPVKEGKPLALDANVWAEDNCSIPVKYTDTERWNKENLSIVAFVFEGTQILNTVRVKVSDGNTEEE